MTVPGLMVQKTLKLACGWGLENFGDEGSRRLSNVSRVWWVIPIGAHRANVLLEMWTVKSRLMIFQMDEKISFENLTRGTHIIF